MMGSMRRRPAGTLQLSWMGKDLGLVPTSEGAYDYMWVDSDDVRVQEVRSMEIERVVGASDTENLLVIGDSIDVLRSLSHIPEWKKRYQGAVKAVYIDPPFNTSDAFEHYADQLEHSVWLTLMRDRLREMIPLLHPEASVWVHLDDVEVHRMRLLLDELFGDGAFVAEIAWEKVAGRDNRTAISRSHDIILVYALQGRGAWRHTRNLIPRSSSQIALAYSNPDMDERGPWTSGDLSAKADAKRRTEQFYEITLPSGRVVNPPRGRCWLLTKERYEEFESDGRLWFGQDGNSVPRIKRFLSEVQDGLVPRTLWTHTEVGHNDEAKKELLALFPDIANPFDTPKPERLLERIIRIATDPGDVVLDFFAGSGTTAAVAHKLSRRWITCELVENTARSFIIPRLEKVVAGIDAGGITAIEARVPAAGVSLPEGFDADDAFLFQRLLRKISKSIPSNHDSSVKALMDATKTRLNSVNQWSGGGGFRIATLVPAMYEVDDQSGDVLLTDHAQNDRWAIAVAGQLAFTLTPDDPVFVGRKGRQRLVVVDGMVDVSVVRATLSALGEDEICLIVGKSVLPAAEELLRECSRGSRVKQAPDEIFERAIAR